MERKEWREDNTDGFSAEELETLNIAHERLRSRADEIDDGDISEAMNGAISDALNNAFTDGVTAEQLEARAARALGLD